MVNERESVTAKLCSFARAYHSNFGENKIYDDYLAFDLMGKKQYEEMGQLIQNNFDSSKFDSKKWFNQRAIRNAVYDYMLPIPLSRISFAKRELRAFEQKYSGKTEKIQYLICGAGMDSYAFRNTNEKLQIFEVDHPDSQEYKKARIRELDWILPRNLTFVPVDFTKDSLKERLLEQGFNPNLPTFTAILGVSYYLELGVFEETLKVISEITNENSQIIFDFPDETTLSSHAAERVKKLAQITAGLGEPMLKGFSIKEIQNALARNSLKIENYQSPKDIQNLYFSGRRDNLRAYENVHFVKAIKTKRS